MSYQPTLPGLEGDRRAYVRIRLQTLNAAIESHERAYTYWTHSLQSCTCAVCTNQRAIRRERAELEQESAARAKQDRGRRLAKRAGHCAGVGRRRSALNNRPEREYSYNGIGESGRREGWDYWE